MLMEIIEILLRGAVSTARRAWSLEVAEQRSRHLRWLFDSNPGTELEGRENVDLARIDKPPKPLSPLDRRWTETPPSRPN